MSLMLNLLWNQFFPSPPTWGVDQIPDLTGKIAAVTGGYGGVGFETVKALLEKNCHVFILGRSTAKADVALAQLKGTGGNVEFIVVDLEDLASVRTGAEELASKIDHLDILFNNAGVMIPPAEALTKHRVDLQFGCNVVGHYHLTTLLLPLLLASPFKSEGFPRVVNTSSSAHLQAPKGGINFDDLKIEEGKEPKFKLGIVQRYGQSKLGNILLANSLQKRYGAQGLVASSCNPGNLSSDLLRYRSTREQWFASWVLYPVPLGALTQLFLGTTAEGKELGGKYYVPWARPGPTLPEADDKVLQDNMWEWCKKECEGF